MVEAASVLNLKAKTTTKVRIDSPISRETLKLAIATSNAGKLIIYLSFRPFKPKGGFKKDRREI